MSYDETHHPSFDPETDHEPHTVSPTAHLLDELALYGHRPGRENPILARCPNPRWSCVTSIAGPNGETHMIPAGKVERGERKRTVDDVSKAA